jgi:hypothetical protein
MLLNNTVYFLQMSPIENVVPNLVDNSTNQNVELRNKQDRSRDLFGVQLEVRHIPTVLNNVDLLS